jgi:hypothetical protein
MERFLWKGSIATAVLIGGCGQSAVGPQETDKISRAVAASAPTTVPFEFVFDDLNPCSGEIHTVTITGTERFHQHQHNTVAHGERTITTSSGFEGRGTHTTVVTGTMSKQVLNDILTHPSGARIRAHLVLIFDLPSGELRLQQGAVRCIRR